MKPIKKILVPTDFSACATDAVAYAAELAGLTGASITLLHVYQLPQVPPDVNLEITSKMMEAIESAAVRALQQAKAYALRHGEGAPAEIRTKVVSGIPYTEIAKEGKDGYGLIVMGTHGRTGLGHFFIGSVAERVVRIAPCPVLTIRSPDDSTAEAR